MSKVEWPAELMQMLSSLSAEDKTKLAAYKEKGGVEWLRSLDERLWGATKEYTSMDIHP